MRPGDGSAALREARGRQRGSEGGPDTAARLGGRHARRRQRGSEGGTEAAARLGGRHGGGSAARRWQRGSVGGPETVRFGERESGEVEEAVQCSHSKSHIVPTFHSVLFPSRSMTEQEAVYQSVQE